MKLDIKDKSNYLKGLLVLIGKDKKISTDEGDFIMNVGKTLGFDQKFCEEAISTLLENEYISDDPPKFSDENFARSFIEDGISVSITDDELTNMEVDYLKSIAAKNSVDESWFDEKLLKAKKISSNLNFIHPHLAVEKYL